MAETWSVPRGHRGVKLSWRQVFTLQYTYNIIIVCNFRPTTPTHRETIQRKDASYNDSNNNDNNNLMNQLQNLPVLCTRHCNDRRKK